MRETLAGLFEIPQTSRLVVREQILLQLVIGGLGRSHQHWLAERDAGDVLTEDPPGGVLISGAGAHADPLPILIELHPPCPAVLVDEAVSALLFGHQSPPAVEGLASAARRYAERFMVVGLANRNKPSLLHSSEKLHDGYVEGLGEPHSDL